MWAEEGVLFQRSCCVRIIRWYVWGDWQWASVGIKLLLLLFVLLLLKSGGQWHVCCLICSCCVCWRL